MKKKYHKKWERRHIGYKPEVLHETSSAEGMKKFITENGLSGLLDDLERSCAEAEKQGVVDLLFELNDDPYPYYDDTSGVELKIRGWKPMTEKERIREDIRAEKRREREAKKKAKKKEEEEKQLAALLKKYPEKAKEML